MTIAKRLDRLERAVAARGRPKAGEHRESTTVQSVLPMETVERMKRLMSRGETVSAWIAEAVIARIEREEQS